MPEDTSTTTTTGGGDTPKTKKAAAAPAEPIPGVDPDSGEMLAVTVEGLRKRYGLSEKDAEALYADVAREGGFFNPTAEATDYRPPLGVAGLRGKARERVNELLGN